MSSLPEVYRVRTIDAAALGPEDDCSHTTSTGSPNPGNRHTSEAPGAISLSTTQ